MSADVFFYQFAILITVIVAGLLFRKRGSVVAVAAWTLWTMVMVFTKFLFVLQGLTILISWLITKSITESPEYPKYRKNSWKTLTGVTLLFVAGSAAFFFLNPSELTTSSYQPPPQTNTTPAAQSWTTPAPATRTYPSAQSLYEAALANVERQYPVLNPDLSVYDPAALAIVAERKKTLEIQGVPSHVAVQKASDEYFSNPNRRTGQVFKCGKGVFQDFPCAK
ncbi:MAG TPA: hypothetical protein PLE22_03690 [Acidovorax sp.]|nr:hypothetical protein [Acidovorax sp.]